MQTLAGFALAALTLAPIASLADSDPLPGLDLGAIVPGISRGPAAVDRAWLYNDPTVLARPGQAVVTTRVTYSAGDSLTRPFSANVGTRGALLEAGGEVGLGGGFAATALGAEGQDLAGDVRTGALLGLRYSLLSAASTQLVLSGGYLRELQGRDGGWARLSLGHEVGPARLAASVHGERIFDPSRDSVDLMVTAGATFRVFESIRAGLEYVGQDLEGIVDDDAEGGARHIVGPMLAATLWRDRLTLVGGPAVALGAGQGRVLARVALACQF